MSRIATIWLLLGAGAAHGLADTVVGSLQFGIVYPGTVDYPAPLPPGTGIGWGTFIIANVGTVPFYPSNMNFSLALGSNNYPATPSINGQVSQMDFYLLPGEALGFMSGGLADLALVRSFYSSVVNLYNFSPIQANLANPLNSGVFLRNTEGRLIASVGLGESQAAFDMLLITRDPQSGNSTQILDIATVTSTVSDYTTEIDPNRLALPSVPEPASTVVMVAGLGIVLLVHLRVAGA